MGRPDYKAMNAAVLAFLAAYDDLDHDTEDMDRRASAVYEAFGGAEYDTLRQLTLKGPVEDGDCVSKSARDQFITWGLAVRCVVKGEEGFTAATYAALEIWKTATERAASDLVAKTLSSKEPPHAD